jgi:hypothetical protein
MSLSWDLTECDDYKALKTDKEWPVTDAIIWYAMFTDIGWKVTSSNVTDFYARIHVFEKLHGTLLSTSDEPYFITPVDVRKRIGLKVNVSPKTKLQFLKHTALRAYNEALQEYNRNLKTEV